MPAVVVPTALMRTHSTRLPSVPAVSTVPEVVGAVSEVSALEMVTAQHRGSSMKTGLVLAAIAYLPCTQPRIDEGARRKHGRQLARGDRPGGDLGRPHRPGGDLGSA